MPLVGSVQKLGVTVSEEVRLVLILLPMSFVLPAVCVLNQQISGHMWILPVYLYHKT